MTAVASVRFESRPAVPRLILGRGRQMSVSGFERICVCESWRPRLVIFFKACIYYVLSLSMIDCKE